MGERKIQAPAFGTRFGRGQVIREVKLSRGGRNIRGLELICDCGTVYQAQLHYVIKGSTKSCGCLRRDMVIEKNKTEEARSRPHPGTPTHGMKNHPLYRLWANIRRRCYDESSRDYRWYGARGIILCERWHDVRLFIEDIEAEIGPRPPGLSLDRRDNDGNYEPGNVRWVTQLVQVRNSRRCLSAKPPEEAQPAAGKQVQQADTVPASYVPGSRPRTVEDHPGTQPA